MEPAKTNQTLTKILEIKDYGGLESVAKKLAYLKGKQSVYHNLTILDIIVCPSDQELYQAFFRQYLISKNWRIVASVLKDVDMEVVALLGDPLEPTLFVKVKLKDLIMQESINPDDLLR